MAIATDIQTGAATSEPGSVFTPTEDITTYELAQIFAFVLEAQNAYFLSNFMATLPAGCHKHFAQRATDTSQKLFWQTAG